MNSQNSYQWFRNHSIIWLQNYKKKAIQSSFLGGKIEFYGYFLTYLMFLPPNTTTKYLQKHPKTFTGAFEL